MRAQACAAPIPAEASTMRKLIFAILTALALAGGMAAATTLMAPPAHACDAATVRSC
jgi:hypothetical protein